MDYHKGSFDDEELTQMAHEIEQELFPKGQYVVDDQHIIPLTKENLMHKASKTNQSYTVVVHYGVGRFEYNFNSNTNSWNNNTYLNFKEKVSEHYNLTNECGLYEEIRGDGIDGWQQWMDIDDDDDLINAFQDIMEHNDDIPTLLHLYVKDLDMDQMMNLIQQKNEIMKAMNEELETLLKLPKNQLQQKLAQMKVFGDKLLLIDHINEEIQNIKNKSQTIRDALAQKHDEFNDENEICLNDVNNAQLQDSEDRKQDEDEPFTFHLVGFGTNNPSNCSSIKIMENRNGISIKSTLKKESAIKQLRQLICDTFNISNPQNDGDDILILYGNLVINEEFTDDHTLHDAGIVNNSCLLIILKDKETTVEDTHDDIVQLSIHQMFDRNTKQDSDEKKGGDSDEKQNESQDEMNIGLLLQRLQIEKALSLDIITQEKDVEVFRMPQCGHSMTAESLYDYILSLCFNKGKALKCAHFECDKVWKYPIIKQYLLSDAYATAEDKMKCTKLEVLLSRNVLFNHEIYAIQKCIQCNALLYRLKSDKMNKNKFLTKCRMCEKQFCWSCNKEWQSTHSCDVSFRFQVLQILSQCELKTIGNQENVPSVRACVSCSALINHVDACKHMKCGECKKDFCFVCLKPKNDNNEWQCGGYSDQCPNGVHARQENKDLPAMTYTKQLQLF